jgi:glycosyltransferase involved in cell wall biosynthesis
MITVLMTTYNCGEYISQAIKSVLNQTYKNFELLIIDDGSIDNTTQIVKGFKDERINYIKRDHFGRAASLNYGLNKASNDVIALMDADDISHIQRLENQLINYSNQLNEIIFTAAAYFKSNKILFIGDINLTEEKFYYNLALHGPYNNATAIFNRTHILKHGGYNELLTQSEDHDLWLRLKDNSIIKQLNEFFYFIRLRESSLSYDHFFNAKNITYNILEEYYINLSSTFKLESKDDEFKLRGWREYFYGSLNLMRREWMSMNLKLWDYRMLIAYILSFLPEKIVNLIKMKRLRFRIHYLLTRLFKADKVQKRFDKNLKSL